MRRLLFLVLSLSIGLQAAPSPPTVANIAALRALLPGAYPAVQVMGYTSVGDPGGGLVNWVAASTKAAAACSVYVPNSAPAVGRWERPSSPFRLAAQCGVATLDDTIAGVITYTGLVGSGTRMVVVGPTGTATTQSIPAGGSLANPTGTIGLAAVNGALTSAMRSDGAPALSQAIAPTWTNMHTFAAIGAGTASSIVSASTTPSIAWNETDATANNRWWDFNAGGEQLRLRALNDANNTFTNVMLVDRTGTTIDSLTFPVLAGTGSRMVVAGANGAVTTQAIPSGGSLANPTGTIGLTAVNGVLTSGLRSDGAPALSQAIVPIWSGVHTFTPAPIFSSVTASQVLLVDGSKALTSSAVTGTGSFVRAVGSTLTGNTNIQSIINTAGINLANANGISQYDGGGVNRQLITLRADNWVQIGGGQDQGVEFNAGSGPDRIGSVSVAGEWVLGPDAATQALQAIVQGGVQYRYSKLVPAAITETAGGIAINVALSDFFTATLDDPSTLLNPTNSASGRRFTVRIRQDATGGNPLVFGDKYRFPEGDVPDINTSPNSVNYYSFIYDEVADRWDFVGNAFNLQPAAS